MFTLGLPCSPIFDHPNFFNGSEFVEGLTEILLRHGFPAHDKQPRIGWIVLFVFFQAGMAIPIARRTWLAIQRSHFYSAKGESFFFSSILHTKGQKRKN